MRSSNKQMTIVKPPLTLYPTTQRLQEAVNRLVSGERDTATLIPGMMTIQQFERKLTAELLGPRQALDGFGQSLLISRVIERRRGAEGQGVLAGAAGFPGFLDALIDFINELGAGLVSPGELAALSGYAPGKEKDIAALFGDYTRELKRRGYSDAGALRRALIGALRRDDGAPSPTLARFGSIRLEDIYQFTPYRFELFRLLARRTPVTIVAPTPDNRRRAFGFVVKNLAKFEALEDREGKLEIDFIETEPGPLSILRDELFSLRSDRDRDAQRAVAPVGMFACSSRYREIEEVGAAIVNRRKERGANWRDFGLVFRDIRPYGAIVEDVFSRYGVPFFFKRGLSLSLNPLIRSALSLFRAVDAAYARDDVLRIVHSSYFARFADIDDDETQSLYLEAGIIEGTPAEWNRRLRKAAKKRKGERRTNAEMIAGLTADLLDRLEKLKRQNRPPQFLDRYADLLTWLGLTPASGYDGPKADAIRFRDNNAYAQLIETLADARQAVERMRMGATPLGYEKIRDLLLGHIDRRVVPEPGTMDRNRVQVLNAHDAVGLNIAHVFVCGLHEGEFPQRDTTRPILTEDEREAFNEAHIQKIVKTDPRLAKGLKVFDRAVDKWQEESLLFYQAVLAARESVTFTHSLQELDGGPLMRSLFIDDVLDVLAPGADTEARESLITRPRPLAINKRADDLVDPDEKQAKLLRDLFEGNGDEAALMARVDAIARGAPKWKRFTTLLSLAAMERRRDSFFFETDPSVKRSLASRHTGDLSGDAERVVDILVVRNQGRYSPTALEKYGQCPFRYFAAQLLRLEEAEEPALEMEAKEAGTMVHQILENFYARLIKKGALPLKGDPGEREILVKEAEKVFERLRKEGRLGDPAIWEGERERTMAMLARWLGAEVEDQRKSGFTPAAAELKFDLGKGAEPPFLLSMPCGGDRYLIGAIDRLDVNAGKKSLRVVDYKLGSNRTRYKQMIGDASLGQWSFQPGLYLLLAKEYVERKGLLGRVEQAFAGYRLLNESDASKAYVVTNKVPKEGREDWIELPSGADEPSPSTFGEAVVRTLERIESGTFMAEPRHCEYCDYAGLCRYIATPRAAAENGS